jgi:type I restriction enzyme M protein
MLTDTTLRSAVEALWNKLWSGGLANPLDAIEQLSFLLFLKRLDEREQDAERGAKLRGQKFTPIFPSPDLRWSHWTQLPADTALKHLKETVFPFIKTLGGAGGSFAVQMENAEFKINKPSLLIEACKAIDAMQISAQNQDVQGDLYEYLLGKLNTAGQNGQFRTPRHIIRMMVNMRDPRPGERICDPAAGTCGFLVNAWQHLLETHTDRRDITYDEEGYPHGLTGSKLTKEEWDFSQAKALTGFDSDSGMTMLRIGSMNLMLHGIAAPNFRYTDTLSKAFTEERTYDVVLANPPFKGAIDSADVNPTLPVKCKKTEILFLHLFLRLLENGGRAAASRLTACCLAPPTRTSIFVRSSSRKTVSTASSRCPRAFSDPTLVFPLPSSCSPRAAQRKKSGSTTWSTTGIHWTTNARRSLRMTFPTCWTAGITGGMRSSSRNAPSA